VVYSVTSWNNVPEESEKVCTIFICLFFWGFSLLLFLYLTCYEYSKCLYHRDTKFELFHLLFVWPKIFIGQKGYELFTSCNVFSIQALQFRNFQIWARLCSPCHYIFRAYTRKNLTERCYNGMLQGPTVAVRMFTRPTFNVQPSVLNCECLSQTVSSSDGFQPISSCPLPVVG